MDLLSECYVLKKCMEFVLAFLLIHITSHSQKILIKGTVVDSSANIVLSNTSSVLFQAKDSFIVADTRTNEEGMFHFDNLLAPVDYVLLLRYPGYADYTHKISIKDVRKGVLDLRRINLTLKAKLLEEVVVKGQNSAIKIIGDTTEYVADSFKVKPNASVEDLLKQLPGLQVDQYGNITAHGARVKKVLVDGEEFFNDDPTLVTRNLRADMIGKVQVYDRKSDAAAFTGVDDRVRDKTINLKIKEDKNHGIFGKADVGGGIDKHYSLQGMINAFKAKRKVAAYATTSIILAV